MANNLKPGTIVYHVASPTISGKVTNKKRIFDRHGYEKKKTLVLVRYQKPHPKFGRYEVYCDPDLLFLTSKEAQDRHIPEAVYNEIEHIIES